MGGGPSAVKHTGMGSNWRRDKFQTEMRMIENKELGLGDQWMPIKIVLSIWRIRFTKEKSSVTAWGHSNFMLRRKMVVIGTQNLGRCWPLLSRGKLDVSTVTYVGWSLVWARLVTGLPGDLKLSHQQGMTPEWSLLGLTPPRVKHPLRVFIQLVTF